MADLGDEIAALGRALGNLDQARGSLRADAEAVAASLVEQLPTDLDPLVTTANVPIRLADQLDARVTSRHSFAPRARWYRVNYAICEITWWVARPSDRRRLCPEPVATLVREPYGHNPHAAVLVDVRRSWSDGKVEHAPAGAELFHARALGRTRRLRGLSGLARKFAHVCGVRTHVPLRRKQARVRNRRGRLRLVRRRRAEVDRQRARRV